MEICFIYTVTLPGNSSLVHEQERYNNKMGGRIEELGWTDKSRAMFCTDSGMFHLRQAISCVSLMFFWLMSGCLCAWYGQGRLIWVWSWNNSVLGVKG